MINALYRSGHLRAVVTLGWLLTTSVAPCRADELPRAQPEEVGFSAARLAYLDQFYDERVKRGELAGIVTLVARHGRIVHFNAVGFANTARRIPMARDSLFRLYSMTKPIAAVALMMLYQDGRFQLSDPLSKYIPEFANLKVLRTADSAPQDTVPLLRPPTIQDAMRHTAGFTHGGDATLLDRLYDHEQVFAPEISLQQMMDRLSRIPLRYQPGTQFNYSIGPDVEARLVEILSGERFDEFLSQHLFGPLGMKDTSFTVPAAKLSRLAAVHWLKNGQLVAIDPDHGHPPGHGPSRGWDDTEAGYAADRKLKGGSAGLVSSAEDYYRFAQMLLNQGEWAGAWLLSPLVVRYMTADHLGAIPFGLPGSPPSGLGFGLGFAVMKEPAQAGFMSSVGTYYWSGAAATHFWVDPKEDLVVVAMTQHIGTPAVQNLLPQLRTLVYSALVNP